MNTIIEDYSSQETTEPMYFSECFNRIGLQSALWRRNQVSIFDLYEIMKPELIIANLQSVSLDLFKVLSGKPTELVVNISGSSQEEVSGLESAVQSNKINCPLVFSDGINDVYKTGLNYCPIMKGADIFLQLQNIDGIPEYDIDKAFFIDSDQDVSHEGTYHVISTDQSTKGDMLLPINISHQICKKYKNSEFIQSKKRLSQHFFDVNFYGNEVKTMISGEDAEEISSFVKKHFGEDVQQTVKSRHLCTSRVARLLQKIKRSEEANKVRKIKV